MYSSIQGSFKRLIKYGQKQDINQEAVLNCFQSLLKMSIGNKVVQSQNVKIKNNDALACYIFCIKILLKSETSNCYIEALQSLLHIMKECAPLNCILFYKHGGSQHVKDWIQLLVKKDTEATEMYLRKILELCGLTVFNLGDLDELPFANDIVDTLRQVPDMSRQKRCLLISFVMS